MAKRYCYVFLDEGGNFDFSPGGTKYLTFTAVTTARPFTLYQPLSNLRYDAIEGGLDIEYLHATEDRQAVRDKVFDLIQKNLADLRADCVIVEKSKTGPSFRPMEVFYPKMLGYLLRYLFESSAVDGFDEVIVTTDSIPANSKRNAIEKAVKMSLAKMLPAGVSYRVLHHSSKSALYLQVVDYINWAVYRRWEGGDDRSYRLIAPAIRSEYDIFKMGTKYWYKK